MDCCMIGGYGYEVTDFDKIEERIAHKPHTCYECGRTIEPGETYEYVCGRWEGYFSVYKTCYDCVKTREILSCGGWIYGALWEDIRSYIDMVVCDESAIPWSKIAMLPERSRNTILELIEEQWEVWEDENGERNIESCQPQ